MEEGRSALKILTGTPTQKRPLGWLRHRWECNITRRYYLKQIGVNTRNWVGSAKDRVCCRALVNAALSLWN